MTYTVISVEGLTARYGDRVVLDRLTLDIGHGVLALLGPNGAGKTTLVDTVTTRRRPDSGRVRVLGHDVVEEGAAVRALLGVTGQQASVDVVLTGRENLVLTGRLLGLGRVGSRRRADELLARFDLAEPADRRVGTWSGGMRRRLDLAVSLVTTPRVLVLDEPTTGLDARSRRALWEEVRTVAAAGTTVLLTTQYLEEADVLADRVVVLDGGRVVADGTPDALRRAVGGEVVQVHDAAGAVTEVVSTDGSAADVARVVGGLPPTTRVTVRRPSMDEVFLHLTGAGSRTSTASTASAASPASAAPADDRPVDAEVSA